MNVMNNPFGQAEYLDLAGNMLERQDCRDSTLPGLLEVTGISQHGIATASGLNDYDYQNLSSLTLGHKQLSQISTVSKVPIPSEVLEHFKHIKCHCMMGLFPEIGRAWLTIDSEIFIWTYEQARDVAYYDGLNHLIVSVGLIKPKLGVFIKDVKYLLVLTTPTDIVVLGVTFGDTTKTISSPARNVQSTAIYEEMQLMSKPIFLLSTDNVAIATIKGSECGRIFLGGRDGCLYEIDYHAESSWFGKRCKKVNHSQGILSYMVPSFLKVFSEIDAIIQIVIDNSRKLLYTLTEKGAVEAWNMGESCNEMQRIARLTQNEIAHCACNVIKTVDISIFKPIKFLCPLTSDDCPGLHLLAITQSGVRLFFSTINFNINLQQQPGPASSDINKPNNLYLMHVRLPPGFTPNTTLNKPKNVHSAFYSEGTLLLISTPQQDQDILWSISSAPFLNRPFLAESTTVLNLDGIVWSLAEIKDKRKTTLNSMQRNAQKPKKVALLTNQGAHIVALLKPADILQQLLVACHGPHHEAVKAFFQAQSEREACATSLVLACCDEFRGTDIALWAAQAFMLYGGEPSYQINPAMNPARNLMGYMQPNSTTIDNRSTTPMIMSTPMQNRHSPMGSPFQMLSQTQYPPSPIVTNQVTFSPHQTGMDFSNVVFSAKHDGLYLYVSRVLRPIWKKRSIDQQLCSTISQSDCSIILDDLLAINRFLIENSVHEISGVLRNFNQNSVANSFGQFNMPNSNPIDQRNSAEQAQNEEKKSLLALNYFIRHACEVLSLWKILCEHQFQALVSQLTKEQQISLSSCSFRDLILTRTDMCAFLIVTLINSYLTDNASVTSISSKLREVCPNLYRQEDAVSFKATEILMTSKNCPRMEEKDERLRTALQLCKDAAPNLPLSNICQQFILAKFHEGVVELCATCAAKIDPEEFALHYYRNNEPVEDREGYSAYAARMNYYKEIKQMLDIVYQNACNNNVNNDLQQTITNINFNKDSTMEIMKIVSLATQTSDPLLHVVVYEWLLAHDLISELLAFGEPSLGEFLGRSVKRNPNNLKLTDLLWKYYEKNGQHSAAASILDNLASMQTNSIPLSQRIEYLARAVMCMRNDSVGCSMHNGVLLKDLEDKLEIARVQKVILDAIDGLDSHEAKEAADKLNYCLYDMSQLYSDFAEPFELWECKLTILNCSHHNEPLLIESVWSNILNKAVDAPELSAREKGTRLFSKVHLLAKEFGESGHCFPLAFIIRELEIKCCRLRLDEGTVPEALIAMNLDLELLIDYYARMLSMNERVWANEGNETHLLKSTARLAASIASNSNQIPSRNRRRVAVKVQDLISACLNICYQKPGTENLQQILRETQSRLQRVL
ncbi:nuclear pore complex protein Nup154 [Condylostylus longicornis]|uniref:nuclear pore complex protein Nup154 n=1 Tax=Condylostylus longicornis TaxID=2530218 RepID=UPI00244E483D|nr:nuclear pore complex protein Nup154 [Condylostylus longicornis]